MGKFIPYEEEQLREEAERQKELDRQRDEWQDKIDDMMNGGNSCDGSQYRTRPAVGTLSTDNPQSDAMQIRAEKHCGSPTCRHCN